MPSKFRVRYIFRPLVNLIAKGLSKLGVTPNFATILMLCFSLCSFISLVVFNSLFFFAIFIFITGIMDGCDGAIARLIDRKTKFGGFFDSTMDRFSEFVIFLALLLYSWFQVLFNFIDMKLIIIIAFFASLMISYSRARAEIICPGDYDIGLMARSERLFLLFLFGILAQFIGFMNLFLFIFMWLVIGTFLFRAFKFNKHIKENAEAPKENSDE